MHTWIVLDNGNVGGTGNSYSLDDLYLCLRKGHGGENQHIIVHAFVIRLREQAKQLFKNLERIRAMDFGNNHDSFLAFKFENLSERRRVVIFFWLVWHHHNGSVVFIGDG